MPETDKLFAGGMPALYERILVPMIFEPYARATAERLAVHRPRTVLEVAAGTGVLTRAMAASLGPDARIVATDLNQPMLDMAMASQGPDSRISWQQADGLALPFDDQCFDAVACQFGVMFFPDKVKGFSEARRVLKPTGCYIFSVWDKLDANEAIDAACQALAGLFPDDPPRFMERVPHGYFDLGIIRSDLQKAGFSLSNAETVDRTSHAASALEAAIGFCQGNPLRGEIEARAPGRLQEVTEAVAEALRKRFGHGAIKGRIRAHIFTALP